MDPRTHAAVTWLLNCDEPAIRLMTAATSPVNRQMKTPARCAGRRQGDGAAIRPAARRRVRRPPVPQVDRRALAGWSPWQSWPSPARAARGRGCRSRPRLAGQPAPPRPAHRRAHPRPRLHRGKRPGRLLPARPGRRPAGPLPGRIPDRLAMARRRVELRPGRDRAALLLPRVAGPGLGTARVRAGHRRSGRQGRGQPHRRAVPGPPDRQVF